MSLRTGGSGLAGRFLGVGFALTGFVAAAPGSPVGPGDWPARGPFGAFTWVAWFVSTALALTLLVLAATLAASRRAVLIGRVLPAALSFAALAAAAFTAATGAERIVRSPVASLVLAVVGLIALRAFAAGIDSGRSGHDRGADVVD